MDHGGWPSAPYINSTMARAMSSDQLRLALSIMALGDEKPEDKKEPKRTKKRQSKTRDAKKDCDDPWCI